MEPQQEHEKKIDYRLGCSKEMYFYFLSSSLSFISVLRSRTWNKVVLGQFFWHKSALKTKILYLKLCKIIVIKVCYSVAVSVVQKLHLSGTCIFGVLNKFLMSQGGNEYQLRIIY